MERFKTCEKEAKMKQFSKAALGQVRSSSSSGREQPRAGGWGGADLQLTTG
jgi:CCR4-NOT transcriptional regulation complex NOT5 subunit